MAEQDLRALYFAAITAYNTYRKSPTKKNHKAWVKAYEAQEANGAAIRKMLATGLVPKPKKRGL